MFTLNRWWCICRFQWWCFGYQTKRSILKNTSSSERFITDLITQVHISIIVLLCSSCCMITLCVHMFQREIFPPDEKLHVSILSKCFIWCRYLGRWSTIQQQHPTGVLKTHIYSLHKWDAMTGCVLHVPFLMLKQRQELEDFKDRMRNRKEQKMLKQMAMQSEEWL